MAFFPLGHDGGGNGIAQDVGHGTAHVQEVIDAQDQQQAGFRQVEHGQHGGHHHQGGPGYAGDALGGDHQHQQHGELGAQGEGDVVGLGHEEGGEGGVDHRAVQVEGVAQGQDEAGDPVLDAELFQLLHQLGIDGLAAGGRKTDQHGTAHQLEQAEDILAQDQVAGADEDQPEGAPG